MKIQNVDPAVIRKNLSDEVGRLMDVKGFPSCGVLAQSAGVSKSSVYNMMACRTSVTVKTLLKLTVALGVTFEHFRPCFFPGR